MNLIYKLKVEGILIKKTHTSYFMNGTSYLLHHRLNASALQFSEYKVHYITQLNTNLEHAPLLDMVWLIISNSHEV